jgi:hypothetical protein
MPLTIKRSKRDLAPYYFSAVNHDYATNARGGCCRIARESVYVVSLVFTSENDFTEKRPSVVLIEL